jgi:hypothetical protein
MTNSLGSYNSGALVPGDYRVRVSAKVFSLVDVLLTVLVGNPATAIVDLQLGQEAQVVEVQDAIPVNRAAYSAGRAESGAD